MLETSSFSPRQSCRFSARHGSVHCIRIAVFRRKDPTPMGQFHSPHFIGWLHQIGIVKLPRLRRNGWGFGISGAHTASRAIVISHQAVKAWVRAVRWASAESRLRGKWKRLAT